MAVVALTACGAQDLPSLTARPETRASPSPTIGQSRAPATLDPASGPGTQATYTEAICPAFEALALLDPRLAALRGARADGVDPTTLAAEIESVAEELRQIQNDLAAVPDWSPGIILRNEVILALHPLRSSLIDAHAALADPDAADRLAAVPFIARPSIDLGMQRATDAGFVCSFG